MHGCARPTTRPARLPRAGASLLRRRHRASAARLPRRWPPRLRRGSRTDPSTPSVRLALLRHELPDADPRRRRPARQFLGPAPETPTTRSFSTSTRRCDDRLRRCAARRAEPRRRPAGMVRRSDRDEFYELRIRDLQTGCDLDEAIQRPIRGLPGRGLAIAALSRRRRAQPAQSGLASPHRHGPSDDELVFEEADRRFELTLPAREAAMWRSSPRHRATPRGPPRRPNDASAGARVVQPARAGTEYRVDHCATGELFLVTDMNEREFALMRTSVSTPGTRSRPRRRENWTDIACAAVAPARGDTRLLQCDVFDRHLLLTVRRACGPLLVITDHGARSDSRSHRRSRAERFGSRIRRSTRAVR